MRRFDVGTMIGAALILLGGLLFLEKLGFLRGASDLFWGLIFLVGAGYFFYVFWRAPQSQWWAVIPAMTLLGIAGEIVLPASLHYWSGALFLGAIGLSFWIVYGMNKARWGAIIPGGVLFTLAVITVLDERFSGMDTGGIFFLGLGLTFLLVALLPNSTGKTQWAYIPALILLLLGALLASSTTTGLTAYVWPVVLILAGIAIIVWYFMRRDEGI